MKTAMQDLIEWYQREHFVKTTFYIQLLNKFEELLEKEKEQIIDAYENGVGDENERNLSGQFTNAEQYYNQTYNN